MKATSLMLLLVLATIPLAGCAGNVSADRQIDDAVVAIRARDALARDATLARYDITVAVQQGVASLEGAVRTNEERERAARLVAAVEGVRGVENRIAVR